MGLRFKLENDFKAELKDYAEARKEAAKNKEKFTDPKPVMKKGQTDGQSLQD